MGNLVNVVPTGWWSDSYNVMEFGTKDPVRTVVVPRVPACKICGDLNDHYGQPHSAANNRWEDRYQYLYNSFAATRSEAETYAERYLKRLRGEAY